VSLFVTPKHNPVVAANSDGNAVGFVPAVDPVLMFALGSGRCL
jgi:hypothetical protein